MCPAARLAQGKELGSGPAFVNNSSAATGRPNLWRPLDITRIWLRRPKPGYLGRDDLPRHMGDNSFGAVAAESNLASNGLHTPKLRLCLAPIKLDPLSLAVPSWKLKEVEKFEEDISQYPMDFCCSFHLAASWSMPGAAVSWPQWHSPPERNKPFQGRRVCTAWRPITPGSHQCVAASRLLKHKECFIYARLQGTGSNAASGCKLVT